MATSARPVVGEVEVRALGAPQVEGNRLRGLIPYNTESRDLGGWREKIAPTALDAAQMDDTVALVEHDLGRLLGRRSAGTLRVEQRSDGLAWEVDLPPTTLGADVREMVRRGDLDQTSWQMTVARDSWRGELRTVEAIGELLDVSVVARGAYAAAAPAELRHQARGPGAAPDNTNDTQGAQVPETTADTAATTTETEDRAAPAGGLRVTDTPAPEPERPIEARVLDGIRAVRRGESRALTTAASIAPTELSTHLFDRLRSSSVALASGVTVIATDRHEVEFPALTADVSPSWVSEGTPITAGDPTFAVVTAVPRKLAHLVQCTNEVLSDSDPSVLDVVQSHLLTVLGLKLDLGVFEGSGVAPEITGLKNQAGIGSVSMGTNGATISNLDPIADAIEKLEDANARPGAIVLAPRTWGQIRKLKDTQNRPLVNSGTTDTPASIYGVKVYVSSQLSVTETQGSAANQCSSIYVYDPSQVVLVRRQDAEIEVDRSRLFNSDQSEIRGKLRCDVVLPNPTACVRVAGLKP